MSATLRAPTAPRLSLGADTAADLMSPNPMSIDADDTVTEAVAALTDRGYSAAPVIDAAGRPVGVVSRADILIHERERTHRTPTVLDEPVRGFQVEDVDPTRVRDIMTPAVFSVTPDTPAAQVVEQMLGLRVHQLYVVGADGVLVGVISTLDVLRALRPE